METSFFIYECKSSQHTSIVRIGDASDTKPFATCWLEMFCLVEALIPSYVVASPVTRPRPSSTTIIVEPVVATFQVWQPPRIFYMPTTSSLPYLLIA